MSKGILIAKTANEDTYSKYDNTYKITHESKLKMKWNTMKWILDNKRGKFYK